MFKEITIILMITELIMVTPLALGLLNQSWTEKHHVSPLFPLTGIEIY